MWFHKIHKMAMISVVSGLLVTHFADLQHLLIRHFPSTQKDRLAAVLPYVINQRFSLEERYFLTIRATLKMMAWSNSRRSRPVSFLIFSSR